ncbi:MAG: hypothetical protein JNM40_06435 [Myxococcales bacterium]|nr:hypothetical protein [Myxococcales bacterium]
MKKCPICGRKVVSKRKDAIYCRNPRCRKKAFEARKEQAASATPSSSPNKASVVVAFPDGTKWLMELTPIQPTKQTIVPTLTQVPSEVPSNIEGSASERSVQTDFHPATSPNGSEQISVAVSDDAEAAPMIEGETDHAEAVGDTSVLQNGSETVPLIVADSDQIAPVVDSVAENPARSGHAPTSDLAVVPDSVEVPTEMTAVPREPALCTVELYFVDRHDQRMTFESATRYRDGKWRVDLMARAVLGVHPSEGRGLGGQPGRWREFYPHKSPGECGFVENIGVLCWEDGERRAYVAEAGLLSAAFGPTWPDRIRELVARRAVDGSGAG